MGLPVRSDEVQFYEREGFNMNMGRGWFTVLGVLSILAQFLLPSVPLPKEWHDFADKIPGCLGALNVFFGYRAYDLTPEGNKPLTAGVTRKEEVSVQPIKPADGAPPA